MSIRLAAASIFASGQNRVFNCDVQQGKPGIEAQEQKQRPMTKKSSKSSLVWVALAAGVVLLMILDSGSRHAPSGVEHPAVGEPFPALRIRALTGGQQDQPSEIGLTDLQGKVVLLNLWGPWCPKCLDELPELVEISKHFQSEADFELIAVSYPHEETEFERFQADTQACLNRLRLNIPSYIDDVELTSTSVSYLIGGPHGFPASLVLDQQGIVRGIWLGYSPRSVGQMRELIGQLLAEPTAAAAEPKETVTEPTAASAEPAA